VGILRVYQQLSRHTKALTASIMYGIEVITYNFSKIACLLAADRNSVVTLTVKLVNKHGLIKLRFKFF